MALSLLIRAFPPFSWSQKPEQSPMGDLGALVTEDRAEVFRSSTKDSGPSLRQFPTIYLAGTAEGLAYPRRGGVSPSPRPRGRSSPPIRGPVCPASASARLRETSMPASAER